MIKPNSLLIENQYFILIAYHNNYLFRRWLNIVDEQKKR